MKKGRHTHTYIHTYIHTHTHTHTYTHTQRMGGGAEMIHMGTERKNWGSEQSFL